MAKTARKLSVKRTSESDRYVVPNKKSGGWDIFKEGHRRATGHAKTKADAVEQAREILRQAGGGELRVLNRTGKFIDSDTVPARKRNRSASA